MHIQPAVPVERCCSLLRCVRVCQARVPSLLQPRWSRSRSMLGRWWQPRVRSPAYWEYVILTERYVYRE